MTIIINIVGAPCSGKSTLACELFVALKKKHKSSEYVSEYAKELVWAGDFDTLNNQYYVTDKQNKMISAVDGKVDYIVCDSPLVVGMFYNEYNKNNVSNVQKTNEFIKSRIRDTLDRSVYIFIKRDKNIHYSKSGRMHNEEESALIEFQMKQLLISNDIPFIEVFTGISIDYVLSSIIKSLS